MLSPSDSSQYDCTYNSQIREHFHNPNSDISVSADDINVYGSSDLPQGPTIYHTSDNEGYSPDDIIVRDSPSNPSNNGPTCDVSNWGEWSDCSSECDIGSRTRNRHYEYPDRSSDCTHDLYEVNSCRGIL